MENLEDISEEVLEETLFPNFWCVLLYQKSSCLKYANVWDSRTVWKFQYFSVTQILREIKIGESGVSKFAIVSESLYLCWNLPSTRTWFHEKSEWQKNPDISTPWTAFIVLFEKGELLFNCELKTRRRDRNEIFPIFVFYNSFVKMLYNLAFQFHEKKHIKLISFSTS